MTELPRAPQPLAGPAADVRRHRFARHPGRGAARLQRRPPGNAAAELATVRLQNMVEVLGRWRTCVPSDDHLTQRGGTFLLDADDSLLYAHRDAGILGFSATMGRPLSFLVPWLGAADTEALKD